MKYFFTLLLILSFYYQATYAQNLVPNPSFEDTLSCPSGAGQVWRAAGWYIVEGTPDYFNACCTNQLAGISVPNNSWGGQPAATGDAYCGFCTFSSGAKNFREKIGIQLNSPLTMGIRYYVSFKVSNTVSRNPFFNGSSNKTGMLFSTTKYSLNRLSPTNNHSQIWTDSIIRDTTNWTIIKGSFIADSAYLFITIGNFYDDDHTDTIRWSNIGTPFQSYYFIDDVCVTIDSVGCSFNDGIYNLNSNTPFLIYPNPANSLLNVKLGNSEINSITLYNCLGQIVYEDKKIEKNKNYQINTNNCKQGVYLLSIKNSKNVSTTKILIIH